MSTHTENPNAATSAAEAELLRLEPIVEALRQQVEQERQAREQAARPLRALAVDMHTHLCPNEHGGGACRWYSTVGADDPDAADWVEPAHAFWLACITFATGLAQAAGWTVEPPVETEPEE